MKKLIEKDKKLRNEFFLFEHKLFILKSIFTNLNIFTLIRWRAFLKFKTLSQNALKVAMVNRCLKSINNKRFNKLTGFSRHIFLKIIRSGKIPGIRKSSW
jgi:ribosomal protein S14